MDILRGTVVRCTMGVFIAVFTALFLLQRAALAEGGIDCRVVDVPSCSIVKVSTSGGEFYVRYLGIVLPSAGFDRRGRPKFGQKVLSYLKKALEKKRIHLEFDNNWKPKGRVIPAYVFLMDGTFIQAELLLRGYALTVRTTPIFMYYALFRRLEEEARQVGRGMFRPMGYVKEPNDDYKGPYIGNRKYMIFHRSDCPWVKGVLKKNSVIFQTRDSALSQGFKPCLHCRP